MADILIRGMEMPETCGLCKLCLDDSRICNGYCMFFHRRVNMMERDKNCPLVPLPEGHGKLIDADAVIEAHTPDSYELNKMHMTRESFDKLPTVAAIKRAIRNAPTIVPAEGGGEDG